MVFGRGSVDGYLTDQMVRELVDDALAEVPLDGARVLVLIPDSTRTAPVPLMVRTLQESLEGKVAALDFLVALGTHQPMSDAALSRLVGAEVVDGRVGRSTIFNHRWDLPNTFVHIGRLDADEISTISKGLLAQTVDVTVNRLVFDYDWLFICGPTFPHEVVGYSGGNKYFFPGIGGPEVINFSHWLGAVMTSYEVIGTKHTPVRQLIDRAAGFIDRPKLCLSMVVKPRAAKGEELAGLYIGSPEEAYEQAADLSSRIHVVWVDKPFRRVLSVMPEMYDDIWTAAKGLYKMEPAVVAGGEVIIYAPHIEEFSYTHGAVIEAVGYHVRDYFLKQWDRFKDYPWGVLAHSTHLRGIGTFEAGVEKPRIDVALATRISRERCEKVNLKYVDPAEIRFEEWRDREEEGILLVPKAGELLYRVKPGGDR